MGSIIIVWNQFWGTGMGNNPGTLDLDGNPQDNNFDLGLRRARFLAFAQISPRFLILTHWGINNQTIANGGITAGTGKKPQLYMHDVWNEFMVHKKYLYIGAGLHYWNGISRSTNASTLNFMTMDAPIFNWATIELTDQFARQFGVYAKGQIGKLDYRVAVNRPFRVGPFANSDDFNSARAVNIQNDNLAYSGYFYYAFLDTESNKLPFMVGTYMGAKRVFNIGAGFHYQADATANVVNGNVQKHDMALFGLDAFLDMPINPEKGSCISAYSVLYNYNFGTDYIRNIGIMNIGIGGGPGMGFNGPGNAQPTIGTGTISYTNFGYGLPKMTNGSQFMPYAAFTYKNFEALNDPSGQFDIGLNYFLNGHHAKITLNYGTRPIYDADRNLSGSAGQFLIQTHFFL
ncbi:MAG: porin [Bernardetiaceae bacterium]|nr:porin [Bernardetiaceae bacterium]